MPNDKWGVIGDFIYDDFRRGWWEKEACSDLRLRKQMHYECGGEILIGECDSKVDFFLWNMRYVMSF